MNKKEIYLFNEYSFSPFISENHIDKLLNHKDYPTLFIEFEKLFLEVNRRIENSLIDKRLNFPSKNIIIQSPGRIHFNLFLKAIILDKIKSKHKNLKIIVEVYEEELNKNNRFFNPYGYLAKSIGEPFFIKSLGKSKIEYNHDPSSNNFISVLNFSLIYIIYRVLKKFNLIFSKNKYLKIGDNYLTREIETFLWLKGYQAIEISDKFEDFLEKKSIFKVDKTKEKLISEIINSVMKEYLLTKISDTRIVEGYINIVVEYFYNEISELSSYIDSYRKIIKKIKLKKNISFSLTSGLFGTYGKLIYDSLYHNRIKVFSAEHGIGYSFSKDTLYTKYENESLTSDYLFCYNNSAKATREINKNSNLKMIPIGAPSITKKILFRKVLRLYYKKNLKLKSNTIFYISHNIELNAEKYYPNTKPCFEIFNDEKKLLKCLSKVNKQVLYKPYPSRKYLFDKLFYLEKYLESYSNIKLLKV